MPEQITEQMPENLTIFLAQNGLPEPWIPPALQPRMQQVSQWVWGTRENPDSLYNFYPWVQEAATMPVADYILFGQDGHGMQSYALHYYLVQGPLALFLQLEWGGAYGDKDMDAAAIGTQFALTQQISDAAQQRAWQPGERLIIALSNMNGARWGILPHQLDGDAFLAYDAWETSSRVDLQAVLDWLQKQPER